jgi:hypothetical protein
MLAMRLGVHTYVLYRRALRSVRDTWREATD